MRPTLTILISTLAVFMAFSCGRRQTASGTPVRNSTESATVIPERHGGNQAPVALSVPLPEVPSYIEGEKAAVEYILLHYWDKADLANPAWQSNRESLEESFSLFLTVANNYPDLETSRKAVKNMLNKTDLAAAPDNYWTIIDLADKYLYDPNSPLRNEELYIAVLESQLANPHLEDIYKVAPRERLRMALRNRLGSRAADFGFTTTDGRKGSLYGIGSDYVLLFFYNLGCPACKDVREGVLEVLAEEPLASMYKNGELKILALYPDTDMSLWEEYAGDIPSGWINAYDPGQIINDRELYDLRAIPSLYLLDRNKTVLIKDFTDPVLLYSTIAEMESR